MDRLPREGPFWHEEYFELKAPETLQAQEKFCSSLNYTEEPKLGFFPRIRAVSRDKFSLGDTSVWRDRHPLTEHLLWSEFLSSEIPDPQPLLRGSE